MTEETQYEEFAKRMEERFPKMFEGRYGGFAVGKGWYPILEVLCSNIQSHIDWRVKQGQDIAQVEVNQIKEKFGGLRFYYSGGDDEISGMVRMAESMSGVTCEECSAPAETHGPGWIRTICTPCEKKREAERTSYAKQNGFEE